MSAKVTRQRTPFAGMPKFFDGEYAAAALGNKQLWRYAKAAKWIHPAGPPHNRIARNRLTLYALSDFQKLVARIESEGMPPATPEAANAQP